MAATAAIVAACIGAAGAAGSAYMNASKPPAFPGGQQIGGGGTQNKITVPDVYGTQNSGGNSFLGGSGGSPLSKSLMTQTAQPQTLPQGQYGSQQISPYQQQAMQQELGSASKGK
jgi:hypothetical protein